MTSFNQLGLSARALEAVEALGYTEPTPVQERAIPVALEGRDIIAAAKTGTGKTAAFSLPLLDRIGHARHGQGPLALVVTPTRELAMQIEEVCRTIAKHTGHRIGCVVGGVSIEPQAAMLARGVDVLIATPGRLVDLMNQGAASLKQVESLVLDEADRMLDMGFLPDMRRIVGACPEKRQTLLFSATIDEAIERNMAHLLSDPVFIEIARRGEVADTVDQYIVRVDQRAKNDLLIALLEAKGGTRIIVFARTRHRADNTCKKLKRAGFKAAPIHSDRSQNQRKRALDEFAEGKIDIIVATDVLARGIDVSDVNYVVNLDMPTQPEDYVHRVGRTGRAGGEGFAVSFVTPETESELHEVQKLIGREIPEMEVRGWDASASDAAIQAREINRLRKTDPELAQAAAELRSKEKAKAKRAEQAKEETSASPEKAKAGKKRRRKKPTAATSAQSQSAPKGATTQAKRPKQDSRKTPSPAKTTHESKGDRKRTMPQNGAAKRKTETPGGKQGSKPKSDFRPGRSQRAAREQAHERTNKRR